MKTLIKILLTLTTLVFQHAMAQQDISGTWQGKLALGGDTTLTVQFILQKAADGSWAAVVNSPDTGGIKNVKAGAVAYDGSNLKIDVAELSGGYVGVFKEGKFEGTWSQAGSDMPLTLAPYTKPVLSQADKDLLLGEWNGKLEIPAGALTIVFRFEQPEGGEFTGFLDSPDQGAKDIPMADVELVEGELKFKLPRLNGEYKGKLENDELKGTFSQGQPLALNLHKGKYEPPKAVINLSKEAMDKLAGEWHGEMETPMGTLTIVVRFVTNTAGEYVAFEDNPDQGRYDIPLVEAGLVEDTVTLKAPGPSGAFTGKLAGDEITGQVPGPMGNSPLTLKKGKYVAPSYRLSLSSGAMELLQGKWQGKLATPQAALALVFRFESKGAGEYYGFVDSPDQGATGLKITEASLVDGQLSLTIKFPRAEFKGKLSGNELAGEWIQGPGSLPLTMKRE